MTEREQLKAKFIADNNCHEYVREAIPGDASFRTYERLTCGGKTVILMDSPPLTEDVKPFVKVANFLAKQNFSVPNILASDEKNGFLILEDFGNDSFTKLLAPSNLDMLEENNLSEHKIYKEAINLLAKLHKSPVPDGVVPYYDDEKLINEALLLTEWYIPILNGEAINNKLLEEYQIIWKHLLQYTRYLPETLVLRDFHADNLMWLDDREGVNRVGLLDFQDAVIGSPIYDIVSLLEDARRDISQELSEQMITHYLTIRPDVLRKDLLASYSILGAQRNLKIIGFIARKAMRDKNSSYFSMLPRVWGYIEKDLKHPLLLPLKTWLDKVISPQVRKPSKTNEIVSA
jgi:aminoglycoside/choline kinase family phosphotransferase